MLAATCTSGKLNE